MPQRLSLHRRDRYHLRIKAWLCHGATTALVAIGVATSRAADEAPPVIEDLSLEELMTVKVTTVSRQASTVGDSPAAVFVISRDMIQRSGALHIADLLRMVPGVNVASIRSDLWAVSIRGFNAELANKLLVQVDGRTVYNPIYSGVYWDSVDYPLEDIERIEVVRGPGASVWGANAVNGIINIITRSADATQGALVEAGAGSHEQIFSSVRNGEKLGADSFYRVYAKGFQRAPGFNAQQMENDDWRSYQVGFRTDRAPDNPRKFTFQGDWYSTSMSQPDNFPDINNPPTYRATGLNKSLAKGGNLLARWSHDASADTGWALQTYYDRVDREVTGGLAEATIDTFDVDFQKQFLAGERHRMVAGVAYRLQRTVIKGSASFDGAFSLGPARTAGYRNVASGFLQDEIKLRDKLKLTIGSKVEHNHYTGIEYEPSARLLYTPSARRSAWAALSRAVRTPSLLERNVMVSGLPIFIPQGANTIVVFPQIVSNPAVGSERVVAYEAGYRVQATPRLGLDAALFYNKCNDLLVNDLGALALGPVPNSILFPLVFANAENGDSYGLELSANWVAGPRWKVSGAYSYLKMNLQPSASLVPGVASGLIAATGQSPRHQLYVRSSHELSPRFQVDLIGRAVSELPGFGPKVPGYVTGDVQFTWKPQANVELAVVGQNLLEQRHLEFNGSPLRVEVRRSVYAKLTSRW